VKVFRFSTQKLISSKTQRLKNSAAQKLSGSKTQRLKNSAAQKLSGSPILNRGQFVSFFCCA
jgi:hypothetical protein